MARMEVEPTTRLGRELEKDREYREMTKPAYCEMLDITKPAYLAWLRGSRPEFQNLEQIAKVLEVPITTVIEWVYDLNEGTPGYLSENGFSTVSRIAAKESAAPGRLERLAS